MNRLCRMAFFAWLLCAPACDRSVPERGVPGGARSADQAAAAGESHLVDVSRETGLDFRHDAGPLGDFPMPQIMGSGAALFDFDGDELLDVFLVNGASSAASEGQAPAAPSRLFRQQDDGKFVDVTAAAGLHNPGYGMGAAVGDVDNDGDLDLFVTNYGPDRLFRNNGDGSFSDVTSASGIANPRWGTAACFFDYDRDGWLDLFVVNYLDFYPGSICHDGSGRRDYCGPESFAGTVDKLYRNTTGAAAAQGVSFADVTVTSGIAAGAGRGLGLMCRDFNDDGRCDIYVANDMEPNRLWMQQADGTYRDEAMLRGVAVNHFGRSEASMGVAVGDFDGDGHGDLFLTHLRGETNTLYTAEGDGQFVDSTPNSGLGAPGLQWTGFGVGAVDLEHDGDLDLVVVNGRVKRGPPLPATDVDDFWQDYAEPNQLFFNDGRGVFSDGGSRAGDFVRRIEVSRGLALGDIDNDGDVDLLVTNCAGPARLYRNDFPKRGNWLAVRAVTGGGRRDAVGARITVHAGERQFVGDVNPASSYLCSNDVRVHFGLGDAPRYDSISVDWPDGSGGREVFPGGDANRFLLLTQGSGRPAAREAAP